MNQTATTTTATPRTDATEYDATALWLLARELERENAELRAALDGLAQSVAESQHAKPGTVLQAWLERAYDALAKVQP